MDRWKLYLVVTIVALGCRSAMERGREAGCEDGSEAGLQWAAGDLRACAQPDSAAALDLAAGCLGPSGGMFRREPYNDAYASEWRTCFREAYDDVYDEERLLEEERCLYELRDSGS